MTKRSALLIAGGLVVALLGGMVGATRQVANLRPGAQTIVVRTAQSPAVAAPAEGEGE